jgi:uncharacterized membrane protein
MNGMSVFLLARFIHVVAGVLWVGALMFITWFLLPAIGATGPAGGTLMQQIVRVQKLPVYLMTLMALTILSGLSLFWLNVRASGEAWMHTGPGRTFSLGGALAILAALIGAGVSMPTSGKMAAIGAQVQASGAPPSAAQAAELARLQNRLHRAGQAVAVLLLLAVTCMGVARYIP